MLSLAAFFLMRKKKGAKSEHATVEGGAPGIESGSSAKAVLAGANAAEQLEATKAAQQLADMEALAALKLPTVSSKKSTLLVKEIRENTEKDSAMTAHVLQTLLHEGD